MGLSWRVIAVSGKIIVKLDGVDVRAGQQRDLGIVVVGRLAIGGIKPVSQIICDIADHREDRLPPGHDATGPGKGDPRDIPSLTGKRRNRKPVLAVLPFLRGTVNHFPERGRNLQIQMPCVRGRVGGDNQCVSLVRLDPHFPGPDIERGGIGRFRPRGIYLQSPALFILGNRCRVNGRHLQDRVSVVAGRLSMRVGQPGLAAVLRLRDILVGIRSGTDAHPAIPHPAGQRLHRKPVAGNVAGVVLGEAVETSRQINFLRIGRPEPEHYAVSDTDRRPLFRGGIGDGFGLQSGPDFIPGPAAFLVFYRFRWRSRVWRGLLRRLRAQVQGHRRGGGRDKKEEGFHVFRYYGGTPFSSCLPWRRSLRRTRAG